MKISMLQMITIVCILSVGFLTVAPFVQIAESHGEAHVYEAPVDIVLLSLCEYCGSWSVYILGVTILPFRHGDNENHITRGTLYLYGTSSTCSVCEYSHYV